MTNYVLCLVNTPDGIPFVRRTKPEWQAGLLNLPGGKVEDGETPIDACKREISEECGIDLDHVYLCGEIMGPGYHVFCYFGVGNHDGRDWMDQDGEIDENVEYVRALDFRERKDIIPNLKVIVPMMLACMQGWVVRHHEAGAETSFTVAV